MWPLLSAELAEEIKPNGVVERTCVREMPTAIWDILRYRRCKTGTFNNASLAALQGLLRHLLRREDYQGSLAHTTAVNEARLRLVQD